MTTSFKNEQNLPPINELCGQSTGQETESSKSSEQIPSPQTGINCVIAEQVWFELFAILQCEEEDDAMQQLCTLLLVPWQYVFLLVLFLEQLSYCVCVYWSPVIAVCVSHLKDWAFKNWKNVWKMSDHFSQSTWDFEFNCHS